MIKNFKGGGGKMEQKLFSTKMAELRSLKRKAEAMNDQSVVNRIATMIALERNNISDFTAMDSLVVESVRESRSFNEICKASLIVH